MIDVYQSPTHGYVDGIGFSNTHGGIVLARRWFRSSSLPTTTVWYNTGTRVG